MRAVEVKVSGLKSLRDTQILDLQNYNVFVGTNNSGKSTILQVFELLRGVQASLVETQDLVSDRLTEGAIRISMTFDLFPTEIERMTTKYGLDLNVDLSRLTRWEYEFECRPGSPPWRADQLYLLGYSLVDGVEAVNFARIRSLDNPELGHRALPHSDALSAAVSSPSQPIPQLLQSRRIGRKNVQRSLMSIGSRSSEEPFHVAILREFLESVHTLGSIRSAVKSAEPEETTTLASSGQDLVLLLNTWASNKPELFAQLLQLAMRLFPEVKGIHTPLEGKNTILRIASGRELPPSQAFSLPHVGMGIQQTLMVAASVLSAPPGDVILIEEPENNLHPGAQRGLAKFVREHGIDLDKQILLTTQSPIFVCTRPRCSTYLVRLIDKEGTKVFRLEPGEESGIREELGLRNIDVFFYDAVVFWEGDSEAIAMPIFLDILAEEEGYTTQELGLTCRILRGSGKGKMRALRNLLELLAQGDIVPYVILDDDEGTKAALQNLVDDGLLPTGHYYVWQGRPTFGRNPDVGTEFEDSFANDQLVSAAMEVAKEDGYDLHLDVVEFARRCQRSRKKTSKELRDYCWEQGQYDLSKSALNHRLAVSVSNELTGEAERTVDEYEFERVIRDLFDKVRKRA